MLKNCEYSIVNADGKKKYGVTTDGTVDISETKTSRLNVRLTSNSLYNPIRSTYIKHHSTETALSSLNDHLITIIRHQHVSYLCLLDLFAEFDIIISFNSPPSSLILVQYHRHYPYTVQNLLSISLVLCPCLWFYITPIRFPVAYPRALSLALSFSNSTQHFSAFSSHCGNLTITSI